jgi:hypothetical protein
MLIDLNKDGDSSLLWKLLSIEMEAIPKEITLIVLSFNPSLSSLHLIKLNLL